MNRFFLRVIIMQINRLYLWSIHSCRGFSLDGGAPHCCLCFFFFFFELFILVKHFHRVAPRSSAAVSVQHLQLCGFEATISIQSISPLPAHQTILWLCAVWHSVVKQTSRAANMAIHVLLWTYVCVNMWKRLTKRKDHFKLPTLTWV